MLPRLSERARMAVSAVLVLVLSAGVYSSLHSNHLMTLPSPTRDESLVVISHDVKPGFSVIQFPRYGGSHTHSSYRLLDTGYSQYFAILENGLLMTTTDLNPLRGRPITLLVIEESEPEENNEANIELRSSIRHTVRIHVLDSRRRLHFPHDVMDTGYVEENAPPGTRVMGLPSDALRPRSLRHPASTHIRLSITAGNENEAFMLEQGDDNLPRLVTATPLDRERTPEYWLTIKAVDDVLDPSDDEASTKIHIKITDLNDNAPRFPKRPYRFRVPRNATRFSTVGTVAARDADGDHVAYRIISGPSGLVVIVPQTGELLLLLLPPYGKDDLVSLGPKPQDGTTTTLAPLQRSYELEIEAHDIGRTPSQYSDPPAKVYIEFGDPYEDEIEEDGVVLHRIEKRRVTRAVRPTKRTEFMESDGATAGLIVFQLEKETERETFKIRDENSWVTVEPSGAVRVKRSWDYEELGPEKTIDFWVTITNAGVGGK
ncbi:hypothetical protein B566_EDAN005281 [Ephemera danica]|nr:hypothetical protein B566_EDAN005281 [Ephemera danica]